MHELISTMLESERAAMHNENQRTLCVSAGFSLSDRQCDFQTMINLHQGCRCQMTKLPMEA